MHKTKLFLLFLFISLVSTAQEKIPFIDFDDISEQVSEAAQSKDYEKTLEILNKINKNDSMYCNVLVSKSYYLLNSEKYNQAIKVTDEGLSLDCYANNQSFYNNKGLAYFYLEKNNEALNVFNKGLETYPKSYLLWYNKGAVLEKLGKINEAIKAYQTSITLNPTYANPHLKLGNICYKQERISQALMCYDIYLLLNFDKESAFNTLNSLNNVVAERNENEANPDIQISPDDDTFDNLDLILSNKIALNKNYETGNKININLTKQNHALLTQLVEFEGNGGFWDKKYVQLFKWISENNLFDNFTYTLSYSIKNEKFVKIIEQNKKEISSFIELFYKKWRDILGTNTILFNGKEQDVTYSYNNSYVKAIGTTSNEIPVGNWEFYNNSGQLTAYGKFNNNGEKTEKWTWRYINGNLKETAVYENGVLNGDNLHFFKNGKPYIIANYKGDKLDGEYKYYNDKGALVQKKYLKNGELDGVYKSFFDIGEDLMEFYIPYKNNSIEDKAIEYYTNGNVYSEIPFANGKRQGVEKKYFWNKNISSEINYSEGELNGDYKTFYSNGNPREIGQSLNDFYNGPWKTFYKDSILQSEFTYDKGNLDGEYKFYDTDGKLYYKYQYRKGEVIEYTYYNKQGEILKEERKKGGEFQFTGYSPEGNIVSEGLYDIKGGKEGLWKFYSSNGVLNGTGNYSEDKLIGEYLNYYNNGEIESISNYKNDSLTGYYQEFHKNGQLKRQGWYKNNLAHGEWRSYYIDGTLQEVNFYHKSQLHGFQESYSCNGKLELISKYDYGDLVSEINYDHLGNPLQQINYRPKETNFTITYNYTNKTPKLKIDYVNGVKHGKYIDYDFYGNKRAEGNYTNGTQDGKWVWYYPNGNVETIRNYLNGNLNGETIDYFEDGSIEEKRYYEYGSAEGTWISYYDNGKKSLETTYYNDQLHGEKIFYDYSGNLQLIRFYDHGRLIGFSYLDKDSKELPMIPIENETGKIKSYFSNGNPAREMECKNGDFVNSYKTYYFSGQLENEMFYKSNDTDGLDTEYYPNGNVKSEKKYMLGFLHGLTKKYYENGIIKEELNYLNNKKHGECNYYNDKGKLTKKEFYFNGDIYNAETY
ncbi:tetratricopeptide repeat protein [Yeosuana marina]|uniref:tetratricopeptide repeat protein n=1 Tax=Yeosuana marina TaxID=1565536 RepID=UPI0030EE1688